MVNSRSADRGPDDDRDHVVDDAARPAAGQPSAARLIALIDLTNLDDDCTQADIEALCSNAVNHGVAGVCVWPDFVASAAALLRTGGGERSQGTGGEPEITPGINPVIDVVTVVNFPTGDERPYAVEAVTRRCLDDGATEIDVVLPYRRFLAGDVEWCADLLNTVRRATAGFVMKVILETGEIGDVSAISAAADLAIACGADFLKTSTGKTAISATPEALAAMVDAAVGSDRVARSGRVGVKPSGGIRSAADARRFVEVVESRTGAGSVNATNFRFGASGLLQALLDEH